jgi:hypothetical protein
MPLRKLHGRSLCGTVAETVSSAPLSRLLDIRRSRLASMTHTNWRSKVIRIAVLVALVCSFMFLNRLSMAATALTSQFSWLPLGPNSAVTNEGPNFSG